MMNIPKTALSLLLILILLLFSGCGYHFRADGEPVGIEIESIAIPMVESSSSEKGFEADFTTVLRNEFISHARVPLKSKDRASMVLMVDIYEINTQPLTYNSSRTEVSGRVVTHETTSSRRLILRLNVSLIDRSSGKTVWNDSSMTEEARFVVTSDPLVNRKNQKDALIKIARLLSSRIYNRTMERF
jgi:outer membrane lipopolysaccharide assembly protein LptE/RlpB